MSQGSIVTTGAAETNIVKITSKQRKHKVKNAFTEKAFLFGIANLKHISNLHNNCCSKVERSTLDEHYFLKEIPWHLRTF